MVTLTQRDLRWAGKTIGATKLLVKDFGCTITCISMALDWAGKYINPGFLAKYLDFNSGGYLIWKSIARETGLEFVWRQYGFNDRMIADAVKSSDKVCLLELTDYFTGGPKEKHWVLATMKIPFVGYWVADPWYGKRTIVRNKLISGCAILRKK